MEQNNVSMEALREHEAKTREKVIELLGQVGFKPQDCVQYANLFKEHEIDDSILSSNLLNNELLKDIGVEKAGHRLRILNVRNIGLTKAKKGEDFNEKPQESLSLDEALTTKQTDKLLIPSLPDVAPESKSNENNNAISNTSTTTTTTSSSSSSSFFGGTIGIIKRGLGLDVYGSGDSLDDEDNMEEDEEKEDEKRQKIEQPTQAISGVLEAFVRRVKYIPVRLNERERKVLHLLEAALNVSDYTDKVDIISYEKKSKRSHEQLKDICAILSGLLVASDYPSGQKLINNRQFKDNATFFQDVFEIGRRYKIMNPEKMRSDYGKLVYMLQDSALPEIEQLMQFSCIKPIQTVYSLLEAKEGLDLLKDALIFTATQAIVDDKTKSRDEIQRMIKDKERAVEHLADKYETSKLSKTDIKLCLRSVGDNNSFLMGTRDPVVKVIKLLTSNFNPDSIEGEYTLSISYGMGGARLSHDHHRQYHYVLQSLTLWREILHDMFRLWILAEDDLLDNTNRYRLTHTGQGLNRVQDAPRVSATMHRLLSDTKKKLDHWVGSSVIHLGDHNVPNALMFIDKYNQVTRIVNPVALTIEQIDEMVKNPGLKGYIDNAFGGKEHLKKIILVDFFRHAFDGSGADNFFDAGSCIDGRLTSAWNWCEKLPKKSYYPIFKLSGFTGFDGDWQK